MIKKIVLAIVCLAFFGSYAQDGTVSPYSYFGIGELRSTATVENQMMGSISMFSDSIHVNLQNPAAYADLGVRFGETYGITTYTAGISHKQVTLKSATDKESSAVTNLDYLALAFTLKENLGIGIGVMPYTSVGYNLESSIALDDDEEIFQTTNLSGSGGLSRAYVSLGWGITDYLKIGVTGNVNFGSFEDTRLQYADDVQLATFDEKTSSISGFDYTYALNYTPSFNDKYTLYSSIRINSQGNFSARNEERIGTIVADDDSPALGAELEVSDVDLEAIDLRETDVTIPMKTTMGLGFGQDRKWFLGAEYSFQDLTEYYNPFFEFDNLQYQEASTVAAGGFWIPDSRSFKFFERVAYRAGVRMEKTGMIVNDTEIDNFGITFGVGLPLSRSFSNVNLGFEFGKRGNTNAELIEEGYFKFNIGLSLNDQWFRKGKIN